MTVVKQRQKKDFLGVALPWSGTTAQPTWNARAGRLRGALNGGSFRNFVVTAGNQIIKVVPPRRVPPNFASAKQPLPHRETHTHFFLFYTHFFLPPTPPPGAKLHLRPDLSKTFGLESAVQRRRVPRNVVRAIVAACDNIAARSGAECASGPTPAPLRGTAAGRQFCIIAVSATKQARFERSRGHGM